MSTRRSDRWPHQPIGKELVEGHDGNLYIVSRETDDDGTIAYVLLRCSIEVVDAFQYKYEAIRSVATP